MKLNFIAITSILISLWSSINGLPANSLCSSETDKVINVLPKYGENEGWSEYICFINSLNISTPKTGIKLSGNGVEHMEEKEDLDVLVIWFKSVNFEYLPILDDILTEKHEEVTMIIYDGRQNRNSLDLNLEAREDYCEFRNLYKLEIMHFRSKLKKIPSYFLKHAKKLYELYANDNEIEIIPEKLFANSPVLNAVDLNRNKIKVIPENLFANNPKMTHIFLRRNNIVTLPATLLRKNPMLEVFEANGNSIKVIPDHFYEKNTVIKKKFEITSESESELESPEQRQQHERLMSLFQFWIENSKNSKSQNI